jgi:uncharacterized integral membrane protein
MSLLYEEDGMPLKMIGTLLVILIFTFFAGFNIDNKCDVNILFRTFRDVPIFFSLTIAFLCGIAVTLPFTFGKKKSRKDAAAVSDPGKPAAESRKSAAEIRKQKKLAAAEAKRQKKAAAAAAKQKKNVVTAAGPDGTENSGRNE